MSTTVSFVPLAVLPEPVSSFAQFNEELTLHELGHYLPAQSPLKDFIHHNTLHAFQDRKFFDAIRNASSRFGYKVSLSIEEYRQYFKEGKINEKFLDSTIARRKGQHLVGIWKEKLLTGDLSTSALPRIGMLRSNWKKCYQVDLDSMVHPTLFRLVCSYLDQGISSWQFPLQDRNFLNSLREMEKNSLMSFFKSKRVSKLFVESRLELSDLLEMLVGDEKYFSQYLFDQQFAHQGWSGMVATIESQPETLIDSRKITLKDFIIFELLLEMDALDIHNGTGKWKPLSQVMIEKPADLFAPVPPTEYFDAIAIFQEAFEWSFYDEVLAGLIMQQKRQRPYHLKSFQAMFCIDDRECSMRRYLEQEDSHCETFGTPGFFGVEFYFKPVDGQHLTKLCPAPINPKFLIKESGVSTKREVDPHFSKHTHSIYGGWLISQTLGFWSAVKLFFNILRPTGSPASASSFKHMNKDASLSIEAGEHIQYENGLQVGYTLTEMTDRVEGLLRSIGLVKDFAPIVYVVGHGASSVNNPHYAAYDCGACSGRAGSVNSRVICYMANHKGVRDLLEDRGIVIPDTTHFVGAIHDTTRDDIEYFDESALSPELAEMHRKHAMTMRSALDKNAKERSRRFEYVNSSKDLHRLHQEVRNRSVSLFEPRPELNHATNALCIVGRRNLTEHLFLDRRSFLNSYDYQIDPDGTYLKNILRAAAPVCGGINLEYYFSRVDNEKLGAGSKLPHNVMGLFGVANGIDGDLRPGLPSQMIEVHDPVRLLIIVEHFPDVVLNTVRASEATWEWFKNEWVNLVVIQPETHELFVLRKETFEPYLPVSKVHYTEKLDRIIETRMDNLPVYSI